MKVYDLLTGKEVDLPSAAIPSGRYRVTQPCLLNGEVKLSRGAILWRTGPGTASLAPEDQPKQRVSIRFAHAPGQSTAHDVIDLSIAAVVESWSPEVDTTSLPSPLLPAVLRDRMELMFPEPDLERALATGQWDEIAVRPRLDMHYVPETLPVARAKRVQTSAVEHLSQHSELWARRSISGVVPSKVLARVSEDDYAIYENVVFARLLDSCSHWLNGRIAEVRAIADGQSTAIQFEKSDERHRLLIKRICALWGEAWFSEAEDTQATRETLERLEQMRSHVERLRRAGVYKRVPRSAKVSLRLRPTNIFQYDRRYRELRPLWDAFASASTTDRASESERYQSAAARHAAFRNYVLLLLCHALRDMGATRITSTRLSFHVGPWDLEIDAEDIGEVRIQLFACGALLRSRTLVILLTKEDEVVCRAPNRSILYAEDLTTVSAIESCDEDPGVLNPFRFFAVERIRQILEKDLSSLFLDQYPPTVGRVPRHVLNRLSEPEVAVLSTAGDRLVVLPSAKAPAAVQYRWVSDACAGNLETASRLKYAIGLGQWLIRCRACGVNASGPDISADDRALRLVCPSCRLETTLRTSPVRSMRTRFTDWGTGFDLCGGVEVDIRRDELDTQLRHAGIDGLRTDQVGQLSNGKKPRI